MGGHGRNQFTTPLNNQNISQHTGTKAILSQKVHLTPPQRKTNKHVDRTGLGFYPIPQNRTVLLPHMAIDYAGTDLWFENLIDT
jgi:hypothetical protein